MAQDLAIVWLVARSATEVEPQHFCRRCAPTASQSDVGCAICADGPVLARDVIPLTSEDAVIRWLNEQGWRGSANQRGEYVLLCPRCAKFAVWPGDPRRGAGFG